MTASDQARRMDLHRRAVAARKAKAKAKAHAAALASALRAPRRNADQPLPSGATR